MKPLVSIAGIFIIIAMTAVSLIMIMLAKKNKSDINRELRNLSVFLLIHMVFAIVLVDIGQNIGNENFLKIFSLASDAFYFCFVAAWINLIGAFYTFSGHRRMTVEKHSNAIVAVFGIASEVLLAVTGEFDLKDGELYFCMPLAKSAMTAMNLMFAAFVICIGVICFARAALLNQKGVYRTGEMFFSALIIVYMIWVIVFDYAAVNHMQYELLDYVGMDPIFIICAVLDLAVLVFFFRKYPVEEIWVSESKNKEVDVKVFAQKTNLTKRETEVLDCICNGMNNPEIANVLFISENTVKRHINNIFQKTGVQNRYELITKVLGG